ncbi:acyltransferase [Cruoricaptor ignavus]|uniref:Acyltransferase n=1 Tax=Cruoricaptor ignavus TaxID=1118202 RepID=A0A7M1SZX1_9FLAO|nr:acyltransferase family protein [Cruoricaptor ignavus]QOR73128.1 acyltransferase [Cruoricaptor ignavus]
MIFRADIQGLRAIAFLSVFIFHLNKAWLPGGFLGVDIFFVISGYLITTITISDMDKGRFTFGNFFKKRLVRIAPAYYALIFGVSLAACLFYLSTDIKTFRDDLSYALIFLSNKIFSRGDSYFGAKLSENPLLHTWSLAIEMQFYLILPFILYFVKKRRFLVLLVATLVLTALSGYSIYIAGEKLKTYFSLPARIPEFLVGCMIAGRFPRGEKVRTKHSDWLFSLACVALLCCFFLISEDAKFPGPLALVPCTAAAVMLLVETPLSRFLTSRAMVYIGTLSYSLYLWHWPVMAFIRYSTDSYEFTALQVLMICILTFILAWLSFHFVEEKQRKTSWKKFRVALPLSILFLFLFVRYGMWQVKKMKDIEAIYARPYFGMKSHKTPEVEKFGDLNEDTKMVLIGDSHALMMKPFLDKLGQKKGFSFQTLTCDVFPALSGYNEDAIDLNDPSRYRYYEYSQSIVPKTDSLIRSNDVIVITSIFYSRPELAPALKSLIQRLDDKQKLILIKTFPIFIQNPLKINNGMIRNSKMKLSSRDNPNDAAFLQSLKTENVFIYDISKSPVFKTAPYLNDTVIYYNGDHINTYGSRRLADYSGEDFYQFLKEVDPETFKK